MSSNTALCIEGKLIDFKHNINKILEFNDLLVVHVFDSIDKKGFINMSDQPLNSIFAINARGEFEWNIKDIIFDDDMYTSISIDKNENLIARNFNGIAYRINVITKTVIDSFVSK
jgi:hypothetical protein